MTPKISRRYWLGAIAVATSSGLLHSRAVALAEPPGGITKTTELRIADGHSLALPLQSRIYRLKGETDAPVVVTAIAADPRGQWLAAAGDDHVIRILHPSTFQVVHQLAGHRDVIRTLAFDPSGDRLVSAGNDGQLILWDRNEAFAVQQKMAGTPALARVRFAPDAREMAAVGFNNEIYLIGRRNRERSVLHCHCNDLRAVAYRDDNGVIAVAGRSGDLHLFDANSGTLASEHSLHQGRIHDIVFHRQSDLAVCVGEDGNVTVFDSDTRKLKHRIDVTPGKLFAAVVLSRHWVAVAGSDNVIRIVDTNEGRIVQTLEGHHGSITTLAATDNVLFSGGFDATLRRWMISEIGPGEQRIAEIDPTHR